MAESAQPLLSILVCSVEERRSMMEILVGEFMRQISDGTAHVEVMTFIDNKEISIGQKRQLALQAAHGKWIVFFDDDDWPYGHYIDEVVKAIESDPAADCVGVNIDMTTNGMKPQRCLHRFGLVWENKYGKDGWDYHRNITHFNPVLRELALKAGFKDMRFGEDRDYCDRLNPLLTREVYIELPLFHYRYTTTNFKQRYDI